MKQRSGGEGWYVTNTTGKPQTFEGFHNQEAERTVPALRVRIDYQSPRREHFMSAKGGDYLFSFSNTAGRWNSGKFRETTNLDAYAIRNAFESADTPEKALHFLSEAGRFWVWEQVLWSQFQEWQRFFKWLRMEPEVARKDPLGRKALETAGGFSNSFFAISDKEFTHSRFPTDAIAELGPKRVRENEVRDMKELLNLRTFAHNLGWISNRKTMDLCWYDSNNPAPPEDRARSSIRGKKPVVEPYLRIEAWYILEAIAATIYADRAHGLRHQKCKHCLKLFKIESGHEAQFCPAPRHLKSSPCKNAYLQKKRRDRLKQ